MLKKIVVFLIVVGFVACTPTPPSIIMQRNFEYAMNIFPEDAPVYVLGIEHDDLNHYMFRCFVKGEDIEIYESSQYDIGNMYFICYSPYMSYDYYVVKDKYFLCTDKPTEDNPLFAQFLIDNHWGENYTDYEILYGAEKPAVLFEE